MGEDVIESRREKSESNTETSEISLQRASVV